MKLTFVFLTAFLLNVSAKSSAQKVTLHVKNVTLDKVFREIERQTGYGFLFTKKMLKDAGRVTLDVKNEPVNDVLHQCFIEQPLNYTIENNTIVISRKSEVIQVLTSVLQSIIDINGIVKDEKGNPLAGVSVILKGTNKGTSTDVNGHFSIDANAGEVLEFTRVGYKKRNVTVGQSNNLSVVMEIEVAVGDEVVVVGYGTQKKSDLTGAVGIVNVEKTMASRPVTNVQELLAGAVPGLNVSKGSGAVGSGASINIRGTSTIGGSSGVLVLIDGFPGNIYTLNPNDIQSISVLKDAASAAIYGSRAANGVLLVTTKKGGKKGKPVVDVNSSVGLQKPQFKLDFVGSADYMKMWDLALENDGKSPLYGEQGLKDLAAGKYSDNKWYKDIYKKSSIITDHNVAVSGGSDAITYRVAGGYDYQSGTLPNNNYNKFVFRPDINIKLSDKVSVDANLQYTETYILQPEGGTTLWQSQAARASPVSPIFTKKGQYAVGSSMVGNPIAAVNEGGYNKSNYKELFGVFDINYSPIKNWNVKGSFARYSFDQRTSDRVLPYNLYDDDGNIAAQKNIVTSLSEAFNSNYRNTLQLTSDYSYVYRQNNFKLLAGYSQEYFNTENFNAFRDHLPFDDINVLNVGSQANMQNGGSASDVAIQSVFGRLNYDYEGKYLLQANVRADGSSRFAKGHQWGTFPSFSAGWNLQKEKFFHVNGVSQLKIRGSWGILGDAEKVGNYATAEVLSYNPGMYGFNGAVVPGAYNAVAIDPNITWEQAKQTNIGLDVGLLHQKIALTIDYFYNKRDNILYAPPVPVEFGLSGPVRNLLKMDNHGWEFSVDYQDRKSNFNWGINFNAGFSKNKVRSLGSTGPWIIGDNYTDVGSQLNMPYGLAAIGLFKDGSDVKSQEQGPNVFPGNIKYMDIDKNGTIDGNDREILNSKVPINFGSNLNFGWKNFDISANVYGMTKNYRYINGSGGSEGWAFYLSQNARPWALDSWTPDNLNATYPRLSIQYTSNDTKYSSYWLRKASYLKIQNVQIGYTFPQTTLKNSGIRYLRLYLSVQNLATITNYPGFDPEGGWYPLSQTYSFGINLKL